jgi:amino acid transporter
VRAVYTESYAMFTRGGVYRVVKEALGGTLAKLSVSALLFDYILTGPLSGVSAGQYIVGLLAQTLPPLVTGGTGRKRRSTCGPQISRGLYASSGDVLKFMYVTTVIVVLLLVWSGLTLVGFPTDHT